MKLREVGEDRLIAQLVAQLPSRREVLAGPGDDCAVVQAPGEEEQLLLKTDCVVEGVHFEPDEKPAAIGWKAMARVLSDFAAMAGLPRYALITLIAPGERSVRWATEIYRGLERAAARFDVAIVGGETSSTPGPAVLSISAVGTVATDRWISRRGGKAGDLLFVTGKLGGSRRRKHLDFIPRIAEARWLAAHFPLHAMMDLSDGLGADLPRLAEASGVGYELEEQSLPRTRGCTVVQAINDGEDYELLFALAPHDAAGLERKWKRKFPRLSLTRIGTLLPLSPSDRRPSFHGYRHFQ